MPWFMVEDTLPFHPKAIDAGNSAVGLWVRAGAWSMQHLTDGFVPSAIVRMIGSRVEADRLVEVGLWVKAPDGYWFHEWRSRQQSREQVERAREKARLRKQKWREQRGDDD